MVSDPSRPEDTSAGSATALELTHIDKRFGSVHANRSVSLRVAKGSIHGLIGENGAGKSTLMNIIYGFHQADSGTIEVKGRRVQIGRPMDAIAAGIGMVHQHFMLVENHTVLENVILGAEGGRLLAGGLSRARVELERLAADYSLEVPLDARIEDLTVTQLLRRLAPSSTVHDIHREPGRRLGLRDVMLHALVGVTRASIRTIS